MGAPPRRRVLPRNDDDTVVLRPPRLQKTILRRSGPLAAAFGALGVALVVGWFATRTPRMPHAGETQIFRHVGRHFATFRFRDDPAILVIDCPNLHAQGLMFDRIAALVEKADAPHRRILAWSSLEARLAAEHATIGTYYYGNDYSASALRRFFRLARSEHHTLNVLERRLQSEVRHAGLLRPGAIGAVLSIPQAGPTHRVGWQARAVILRHELSHGAYFTLPAYRAFANWFYRTIMTAPERTAFETFLIRQGYNRNDRTLTINETIAYLVFTRDREFFRATAVGLPHQTIAALRNRFIATMPPIWLSKLATTKLPSRT